MKTLKNAQKFIKSGIAVIPLRHRGKEPESAMMGGTWEKYQHSMPTEYDVTCWLASGWQNYGVVAGWQGLAVIDFDDQQAFDIWWDWFLLLNKHGEVYPMPYIVKTARGAHVYIVTGEGANEKRRGVDLKYHGYVVGPGSIHPNGTQYVPLTEYRLIEAFSLDTILPVELFPPMPKNDCSPSCGQIDGNFVSPESYNQLPLEYDPFSAASSANSDLDLITKVKGAVRIENLFAQVKRTSHDGRWYATKCPFHDDKNPSAWVDVQRQLFGCNTCGFKPMDAINLYARMHRVTESDAVSMLAREVGVWG